MAEERVQRILVTILAADVVGYCLLPDSLMIELLEEGFLWHRL